MCCYPRSRWWVRIRTWLNCYALTKLLSTTDFQDEKLQTLISALLSDGYQPYITAVGGSGLGILSPYDDIAADPNADSPPLSPPATPDPNREDGIHGAPQPSIRKGFETITTLELPQWASERGKWLYV